MTPLYYKYIDPIIDYLQPLPKILTDSVVVNTVVLFATVTLIWLYLFRKSCEE